MKKLNEREIDEISACQAYVRYVLLDPDIDDCEVLGAVMMLNRIGIKYVHSGIYERNAVDEYINLEDMKDVVIKLMDVIIKREKQKENNR
jgi:hypothetical protein